MIGVTISYVISGESVKGLYMTGTETLIRT
jgi:hypothetical protein